jgi:hypothetical protein
VILNANKQFAIESGSHLRNVDKVADLNVVSQAFFSKNMDQMYCDTAIIFFD